MLRSVLITAGLVAGTLLFWRRPVVGDGLDAGRSAARVSVVVPARDEEATLPLLLASLRACESAPGEVLVVDDGSTDATAAVARAAGAVVVAPGEPPDGWLGKPWACARGAEAASGDVLVFLDADVVVGPAALGRVVAEVDHHGGLVTVHPHHRTERPYEELSAYCNAVGVLGVGGFTPLRSLDPAGAFGPCLATTAVDYHAAGGHRAVAGRVLDDVHLAHAYRRAGLPVTARFGDEHVAYRMYPAGPGQLVEGWSKNIALGAVGTRWWAATGAALWVAAHAAVVGALVTGPGRAWAAVAYAVVALHLAWVLRRIGDFRWWTWALFPVPLAAFMAVFLRSAVLVTVRRRVRWRGRTIAVGGR